MLQSVVARQVEDVEGKHLLVERRRGPGIVRQQRTPDPLSGLREKIRRVAAARGEDCEDGAVRIGKHGLPSPLRIAFRIGYQLGSMRQRGALGAVDIADSNKRQPGGLPVLAGRYRLLDQSAHRTTVG